MLRRQLCPGLEKQGCWCFGVAAWKLFDGRGIRDHVRRCRRADSPIATLHGRAFTVAFHHQLRDNERLHRRYSIAIISGLKDTALHRRMAPRDMSHEPTGTPEAVERGYATLAQLR